MPTFKENLAKIKELEKNPMCFRGFSQKDKHRIFLALEADLDFLENGHINDKGQQPQPQIVLEDDGSICLHWENDFGDTLDVMGWGVGQEHGVYIKRTTTDAWMDEDIRLEGIIKNETEWDKDGDGNDIVVWPTANLFSVVAMFQQLA